MNSKYRISMLLVCLLLALLPISGLAGEMEIAPDSAAAPTVEAVQESAQETMEPMPQAVDAPIDMPVIEATYEEESPAPAAEAASQSTPEATIAPEETICPLPELTVPPAAIGMDEIEGVASGANYSSGYVRLSSAATGYASASPDAEGVIYLEKGIFYVSARRSSSSSDRLRVHFDDGGETRSVWVDERRLRPMSAEEVYNFVSSRVGRSGVHLYGGNPMLPLDTPSYSSVITYSREVQKNRQEAPAMFVGQTQMILCVGETSPIGVSFSDGKGHAVSFMSENAAIAAVSDDGRVTGISVGSTRVQLKSEFSNLATIEIQVREQ